MSDLESLLRKETSTLNALLCKAAVMHEKAQRSRGEVNGGHLAG